MFNFITPSGKVGDPSVLFQAHPAGDLEMRRENIRRNIARGLPRLTPETGERSSDVMKLVCFGPSLSDNWEKVRDGEGDIWTVSGANTYLWRRGIAARFHLEADPRPHKAKLLIGCCPQTLYLIASRAAPQTFEQLSDRQVVLYHVHSDDEVETIRSLCPHDDILAPAWTMGNTALLMGHVLGYRKFIIYGMDGSFGPDGRQHADDHPREEEAMMKYQIDGKREFLSHPSQIVAAECFIKIMRAHPYGTFEFVGDGLIPYAYERYTKDYR